ncbi:MAG: lipopolysaccharide biosynthesis protein [Candidatus Zipacnadales bacterium]
MWAYHKIEDGHNLLRSMETPHDLTGKTVSGVVWIGATQFARNLVSLVSTAILARLLTPEDFGLVGMATVVTNFAGMFSNFGLSEAAIQRRQLTAEQSSNLFWLNVGTGLVLAVIVAAISPLAAAFYRQPEVAPLTAVVGLSLFLLGMAAQPNALLLRAMRFRAVSLVQLVAVVFANGGAIGVAALGGGVWALIFQIVAHPLAQAITVWLVLPWRPQWFRRRTGTASLVAFGGKFTLIRAIQAGATNVDAALIGRLSDASALGYYSRAMQLLRWPLATIVGALEGVVVSPLARLQDEPHRLASAYTRAVRMLAAIAMPVIAALAVYAPEVVLLVYGPQWQPTILIFRVLCIASAWWVLFTTVEWLFTATGQMDAFLRWASVQSGTFVVCFAVGARYGVIGVAVGFAAATSLTTPFGLWYMCRTSGMSASRMWRDILPIIVVAFLAAGLAYLGMNAVSLHVGLGIWSRVGLGLAATATAYAVLIRILSPQLPGEVLSSLRRGWQMIWRFSGPERPLL